MKIEAFECDLCSKLAKPCLHTSIGLPNGWKRMGKMTHLCPECYKVFKQLRGLTKEVDDE